MVETEILDTLHAPADRLRESNALYHRAKEQA